MDKLFNSKFKWLFIGAALAIVLLVLSRLNFLPGGSNSEYQAVFLTNNQVYFGKLSKLGSDFPILKDVYYLRLAQPLQPQDIRNPSQPQLNLVKLGNELHGPEDEMQINRDQITFVENLRADSRIVQAIIDFQAQQ